MLKPADFRNMLISLFESKCKTWTNTTIDVWYNELKNIPEKHLAIAFKKLIQSSDNFISVGKILEMINSDTSKIKTLTAEHAWTECLNSAKNGGRLQISARSGKALNSLGGMTWLRNADPKDVTWQKKEFMEAYDNTPEYSEIAFTCIGLAAPMYLEQTNNLQLE